MSNTQSPAEIENKIFNILLAHTHASRAVASKELAELFTAEYATKLHQVEQENAGLKRSNTILGAASSVLNDQVNDARALLEKFISRHEAGLLPDQFIYTEIKNFLDGTK